jgi:hypothetical protein
MANLAHLGPTASLGVGGYRSGQAGRAAARHGGPAFHLVLAGAMNGARASRAAMAAPAGVQTVAARVPLAVARATRSENPTSMIPAQSDAALSQAMAQESGGRVDVKNPVHSARGLFQLTAANYHLNPNGARSFGNAVEEAQGGIRYIQQRYGSADKAVEFWRQRHWY